MPVNICGIILKKYSIKLGDKIIIKYNNSRYMNKGILSSFYKYSNNYYLIFDDFRIIDYDRNVEEDSIGPFNIRIHPSGENIESITVIN
jgi:hypothetical protein